MDGRIKRPFNPSNAWDWQTTVQDIGLHTLTAQVKNEYGTQAQDTRRLIIYRRPIEP